MEKLFCLCSYKIITGIFQAQRFEHLPGGDCNVLALLNISGEKILIAMNSGLAFESPTPHLPLLLSTNCTGTAHYAAR